MTAAAWLLRGSAPVNYACWPICGMACSLCRSAMPATPAVEGWNAERSYLPIDSLVDLDVFSTRFCICSQRGHVGQSSCTVQVQLAPSYNKASCGPFSPACQDHKVSTNYSLHSGSWDWQQGHSHALHRCSPSELLRHVAIKWPRAAV